MNNPSMRATMLATVTQTQFLIDESIQTFVPLAKQHPEYVQVLECYANIHEELKFAAKVIKEIK